MAYFSLEYTPNTKSQKILDRAWEHVQSVPYKVTARWLFYRLLQDSLFSTKDDYKNKFLPLLSRARHNNSGNWRPDTLSDDRRAATERGTGYTSTDAWVDMLQNSAICNLARWKGQSYYVELWFEAEAMKSQFEYYTENITLRPFSGMPSIPFKWEIAKSLEESAALYDLPIVILYFGDLDKAGRVIPDTSANDIRSWCEVGFQFIRAGLNPGDEVRYNIPENFEHPGSYQWEAVDDEAAREIIQNTVNRYVDFSVMAEIEKEENATTQQFRRYMAGFTDWLTREPMIGEQADGE